MSANVRALKTSLAKLAALALFSAGTVSLSTISAAANPALDALAGSWRGSGKISFEDGGTEGITCNGYYKGAVDGSFGKATKDAIKAAFGTST